MDGEQLQRRASGGWALMPMVSTQRKLSKLFGHLLPQYLLCSFVKHPRVFYTRYYLPSAWCTCLSGEHSCSAQKAPFSAGVVVACPMLGTINKLVTALWFQRLNIDLSKANLLDSEYFYMNVLSAGLPGVTCELYSLSIFSSGSKKKNGNHITFIWVRMCGRWTVQCVRVI